MCATSTRTGPSAPASGAAASRRPTGRVPPFVVAWVATWLAIMRPTAMRPGSISRPNATIPWVCVGVSINMVLSSQIPAPGTNRIVVSNWACTASRHMKNPWMIWIFPFHWTDEVIKNASSTGGVTSDDEDDESDNDESAEEGSADRLLVF